MKSKRLSPLFGMRPGVYITGLIVLVLLIIIFLVLFLPGIINYGSEVTITTNAPGAVVYIDGHFAGSTPLEIFIPSGEVHIQTEKPFFESTASDHTIGGRAFFSLFSPRREHIDLEISLEDPAGYLSWRMQDIYNWSLVTNFTETYQYPTVVEYTARDVSAVSDDIPSELWDEFVEFLPYLESSQAISEDIQQGLKLLGNDVPDQPEATEIPDQVEAFDVLHLQDEGIELIGFRGESVDDFYLSSSLITREQFDVFIEEETFWHQDNREELIQKGLADDTYLFRHDSITSAAVNVSLYAAEAYAQWLDEAYPQYTIKLPDALQWETAAEQAGENQISGLWQWTGSRFYPGHPGDYTKEPQHLSFSTHYLLKGGSQESSSDSPAALPPSVCSPLAGFRVVVIKE